jgi:hypothetical protein
MDDQIHQPCFQRTTMSHEPKIEKVDGKSPLSLITQRAILVYDNHSKVL